MDLWDLEAVGRDPGLGAEGEWSFAYEEGVFTGTQEGRYMGYLRQHSVAWLDRQGQHLVGWHRSGREMPIHERSKPLSLLLAVWYNDRGVQVIHAGLVAHQGRGVLIAGPSGCGKTTAALACVDTGFCFLGDDYVGIEEAKAGAFVGHSLYNSNRVEPEHLRRFPHLQSHAIEGDASQVEKALVLMAEALPQQVGSQAPIAAIAFPWVGSQPQTCFGPLDKGKALLRLAYSSLRIPARGKAYGLDRLGELVARTPTFWLELGRELASIPEQVRRLLDEAGGP
jgi:hypothetical protein